MALTRGRFTPVLSAAGAHAPQVEVLDDDNGAFLREDCGVLRQPLLPAQAVCEARVLAGTPQADRRGVW